MSKKEAILEAAAKFFSRKGFRHTSIAELSQATGAAQGTIFYHFKNKEEIFLAILEEFKTIITDEFNRYVSGKHFRTGLEMMEGVVSFYLYLAGSMEDRFLLLHRHDAYEFAKANAGCRKQLESIYSCFTDIFEQAIVLGQKDGSISDVPARKTALILFTLVDGLVRFNTYELYDAGTLYGEFIRCCRKILTNGTPET